MEGVNEPSKAAVNIQSQETSSLLPEKVREESQLDSTMEIVDESLDSAMEIVDESPQNVVHLEKDTTELIADMTSGAEPFANDSEPQKEKVVVNNTILVENNTSENQVVIAEVIKEIETHSTSIQQTKDDIVSKESQDNNFQKKVDNLSTSNHMNNFKGNEENINI
jgi:hypothetical protein